MLIAYPLFVYMLKLTSVDTLYLKISIFEALNPFFVNIIEYISWRKEV